MDEEVIKVLKDVRDLLKDIAKKLDRIELNISEREFKSVNPLVLLELPDTLRTTYMVMLKLKEGTAKDVSEITKRGRAIESHYLKYDRPVTHGQAVAAGMICETWISSRLFQMDCTRTDEIISMIDLNFEKFDLTEDNIPELLELMKQDKKVREGKLKFSLIRKLGKASHNIDVDFELIVDSLKFYINR
jgi:hypothetical protein